MKVKKTPATTSDSEGAVTYPYEVFDDDHCETPAEAYQDISQVLETFARLIGKDKDSLTIYDPYYCEGKVIERLGGLGFPNVINRKEDFYENLRLNQVPEYDILVTNPPYSSDHMERLLAYCTSSKKPWLLLVPNYVYMKDYFQRLCGHLRLTFIAPKQRYLYTTPKVGPFLPQLVIHRLSCRLWTT